VAQTLVEMAPNGRLVVPAAARTELGLSGAERFTVSVRGGSIVLTPVAVVPVDRAFPITPSLVESVNRAWAEPGHTVGRETLRQQLAGLVD